MISIAEYILYSQLENPLEVYLYLHDFGQLVSSWRPKIKSLISIIIIKVTQQRANNQPLNRCNYPLQRIVVKIQGNFRQLKIMFILRRLQIVSLLKLFFSSNFLFIWFTYLKIFLFSSISPPSSRPGCAPASSRYNVQADRSAIRCGQVGQLLDNVHVYHVLSEQRIIQALEI